MSLLPKSLVIHSQTIRLEFHFKLSGKDGRPVDASCLAFFAYSPSQHTLITEYDACYLTVITSWENPPLIKIPQTVDGLVRLDETTPIIGRLDDWLQGQTKVVDTFSISLAPLPLSTIPIDLP